MNLMFRYRPVAAGTGAGGMSSRAPAEGAPKAGCGEFFATRNIHKCYEAWKDKLYA